MRLKDNMTIEGILKRDYRMPERFMGKLIEDFPKYPEYFICGLALGKIYDIDTIRKFVRIELGEAPADFGCPITDEQTFHERMGEFIDFVLSTLFIVSPLDYRNRLFFSLGLIYSKEHADQLELTEQEEEKMLNLLEPKLAKYRKEKENETAQKQDN